MDKGQKIDNYCRDCFKNTNHTVKELLKIDGSWHYQVVHYYAIVQCDGCEAVSYRTTTEDYEMMYYDQQENDHFPTTTIVYYPQTLDFHRNELETALLPDKIRIVYEDTLRAFTAKSHLLTAIGFRTIIEAICIDQGIKVKEMEDLKPQIDKMVIKKLITPREAARLHTIRFSGNDSAHDMIVPKEADLYIVLNIVDHLLNNLYIIDQQIKGGLEKVVTDFNGFRTLLSTAMTKLTVGDSLTLGKILGKSARRLHDKGSEFERELLAKIESGEYTKLAKGELKESSDRKLPPVQYYTIVDVDWDRGSDI
ncbi:DUF4145 domain-containing protein [Mucilaginibacter sp. RB4R14]|uniref:DUF4145 domain-containing protein n=1 Tax=Mucilaginibacter aurantiaciroseus TaxID=2949308 RepID=UPI0020912E78|nr:DUF4145 domain-containing protein [Mucilaginibacter aurantiaciroseus]MCO5936916.1 DUF4145 domain-containing protein [Mucilaginibacter aurantiaciroseus]